ncbi:MAG TPA: CoB--CoM heterodisulfide reductase iron-sulfur subunit B family protein [Planctomycetota bacterium]|jgi:heterodisulfide reductase subunit B
MSNEIAFFPGCSLEGTAVEYRQSLEAIAPKLGLSLKEVEDWNCCGATAAHNLNHKLSLALPARILAQAEAAGHRQIVAPCAACSHRLLSTRHELAQDPALSKEISDVIEMPYRGTVQVKNILQLLQDVGFDKIAAACTKKMTGIKIAAYYGCLLVRPAKVMQFDEVENPQSMEKLLAALGAKPVEWGLKTECCGGGFSISRTDAVCKLVKDLLDNAAAEGAVVFAVACPMCQSNLDLRQHNVNQRYGTKYKIPVLYITQWIGLCMGMSPRELGLHQNFVDTAEAIAEAFKPAPAPVKKPVPKPVEEAVGSGSKQ